MSASKDDGQSSCLRRAASWAVAAPLAALFLVAPGNANAQNVDSYNKRLETISTSVDRLSKDYANPMAIVRRFPHQKRLIDARVYYELGNYESAAIMLIDVLDSPTFKGNFEYESAQLMLAKSLLELDNPKAAREFFAEVTKGRDAGLAEEARFYLIEMALTDGSATELQRVVDSLGNVTSSDRTRYGLGKAYLRLDKPDRAQQWLGAIQPQSEFYNRARYYQGVSQTAQNQYPAALGTFRQLTLTKPKTLADKDLIDLAWLAVGRLLQEQKDITGSLNAYQQIGRNSSHYEVALYEMAWSYVKQEQYDKAIQTVDILLLTVEDEKINVDAHVLRGRLNVAMNDFDEAMESYQSILENFAPVRNELATFSKDPRDIQRYFQWLLNRGSDRTKLQAPLSKRTAAWIESTDSIGRVAQVFDRISSESADITAARQVGGDLDRILSSRNRIELFDDLRDGWIRALALENQLINVSGEMLDAQNAAVKGKLDRRDADELAEIVAWRRSMESKVNQLPESFEGYKRRKVEVNERYLDLQRKNFIVEQNLAEVKRQLLALEKFLNDKQFADDGDKLSVEHESRVRSELESEKGELQGLYDELLGLKRQIDVESMDVGAGDTATVGEENLKAKLIQAHKREGMFYDRTGNSVGGGVAKRFGKAAATRLRIFDTIGRLERVINAIDTQVLAKTQSLRATVDGEMNALAGYDTEVKSYDAEGRNLSSTMGEELFRTAQRRMDQVVLEADVGLLDVMWERKSQKTRELQAVNDELGKRSTQLQDDLQALKGDNEEASEEGEK